MRRSAVALGALASLLWVGGALAQPVLPHAVQGAGLRSPLEGQEVTVRGVVSAVKANGFYLATPLGEEDSDPATSEGLLVFTGGAPPPEAQVGNLLEVRGRVAEFTPSTEPYCLSRTELSGALQIRLVASGVALPPPFLLTADQLSPTGPFEQLEPWEGMRVRVEALTVVGPTGGRIDEVQGQVTSNGFFYGVLTGTPRPFREPGVEPPQPLPSSPCCVPRADGNPERLAVDSSGLRGSRPLDVAVGTLVHGLVGPLEGLCRGYALLAEPNPPPTLSPPALPPSPPGADPHLLSVATFNLRRFFDTHDDPALTEPVLTAATWERRLQRTARALVEELGAPDLLAVQEAENLAALAALAEATNAAAAASGRNPRYTPFLLEGQDPGGIDVGFLVATSRLEVREVRQEEKDARLSFDGSPLFDRPPLLIRVAVRRAPLPPYRIQVVNVHLRSLTDIAHPTRGPRVRAKRQEQAETLARLLQRLRQERPQEGLIVLGDFNAFELNDGYVDVLGTVVGRPAPAEQVAVGVSRTLVDPPLLVLTRLLPPGERYSYVYHGNAQTLDHILVSPELEQQVVRVAAVRLNADYPEAWSADDNRLRRLSDHDPVVVHLRLPGEPPRLRLVPRRGGATQ